jgi:hypothetical protein
MPNRSRRPNSTTKRMADYRARLRAAGLRPVQIWVPDTRAPGFADMCRRQARSIAASDTGGEKIMRFIEATYEWPDE